VKNYIAYFDKASLLKLMSDTGYNTYQIMEEIEPCSYLDTSGRALTPNFLEPEVRYIDCNFLRKDDKASDKEREMIIKLYNEIGLERVCKETKTSIRKIYDVGLEKVSRDKMYEWRNSKDES
jgi:glutamate synthase domain-containing protein 2